MKSLIKLNQLTIATKIYLCFAVLVLLSILVQIYGLVQSNKLAGLTDLFYKHPYTVTYESKELEIRVGVVNHELNRMIDNLDSTPYKIFTSKTIVDIQKVQIYSSLTILKDRFQGDPKIINEIHSDINNWDKKINHFYKLVESRNSEMVTYFYNNEMADFLVRVNLKLLKLQSFAKDRAYSFNANAMESKNAQFYKNIGFSFIFILISCFMGYLFTTRLNTSLKFIVKKLQETSESLKDRSEKIKSSSDDLSESSTQQAASLQETVSSVDEINATAEKNAAAAGNSTQISARSNESATEGKKTVDEMLMAIDEISQSNERIIKEITRNNEEISNIINVVSEIGQRTKVINDIVFQTKLLSLNASVEASRAGEHGKGFAVVAGEIGNLAAMSGTASQEINDILSTSINQVSDIVKKSQSIIQELVRTGKTKVKAGQQKAEKCNEALDIILANVDSVNEMTREISIASTEQSTGVNEINKAMRELDIVTHRNSDIAQQTAQSAKDLEQRATSLQEIVYELSLLIDKK